MDVLIVTNRVKIAAAAWNLRAFEESVTPALLVQRQSFATAQVTKPLKLLTIPRGHDALATSLENSRLCLRPHDLLYPVKKGVFRGQIPY